MSSHRSRRLIVHQNLCRAFFAVPALRVWSVFLFFVALFPAALLAGQQNGGDQAFAELVVDESQKSKERSKVEPILRRPGSEFDLGHRDENEEKLNQEILEDFFRRYFLARMTNASKIGQLPQIRGEVRDKCAASKNKSNVMDELNQITSGMMHALCNGVLQTTDASGQTQQVIVIQESVRDQNDQLRLVQAKDDLVAKDQVFDLSGRPVAQSNIATLAPAEADFHPAVKLNAMLVLRDLNDKQPKKGKPQTAEPRVNTQRDLIAYLESSEKLSDILLIGALSGIARHAEFEQDSNRKNRIATVVAAVVDLPGAAGRSDDAAGWIRRQAVDILGNIGLPGNGSRYVAKLYKIIRDEKEPLPLRIAAAEALRKMDLSRLPDGVMEKLTRSLTQLASDACDYEIVEQLRQNRPFSKPRLQHRLAAVRLAVTGDLQGEATDGGQMAGGLMAVATDEDQASLQKLLTEIQKIETRLSTLAATTPSNQVEDLLQESVRGLKGLQVTEDGPQPPAPQTAENP